MRTQADALSGSGLAEPLAFDDVEHLIGRLTAPHLDGGRLELLSIARAHDGAYVVLDCTAHAPGGHASLERAMAEIASTLDPAVLGATPGAAVRVAVA